MIAGVQLLDISGDAERVIFELGLDYEDQSKVIAVPGGVPEAIENVMDGITLTEVDNGMLKLVAEDTGVHMPPVAKGEKLVLKPKDGRRFLNAVYLRYCRNNGYTAARPIIEE
jgi:hypothetical protein